MICDNLTVRDGILQFGGKNTLELAERYGTPLYVMDEDKIRANCRTYRTALADAFGPEAMPLYAGKAASFTKLIRIIKEEGLGLDVVSGGEIATALRAGFPMEHAYFHSNNKTDADIEYAIENGIGYFVADNREEVDAVNAIAARFGIRQKILLRLTPGIDPHTHAKITTGQVDSKFGSAIETGQAMRITQLALTMPHLELMEMFLYI